MNLQIAPLLGQEPELTLKIVTTPKVEKKKKKKKTLILEKMEGRNRRSRSG